MNKRQKEVAQAQLNSEQAVLKQLEKQYQSALKDIDRKIRILQSDELTQSRIYRLEYQKALKGQIEGIIEKLHGDEYTTIQDYLSHSYTDAFIGTMYDLHGQGVPLITPIDQKAAVKAIQIDSKISGGLYDALGVDTKKLKKTIANEITRGIAGGMSNNEIARNITSATKAPLSRARTIARTESHRITQASTYNAQTVAKSKGADVVKQWDSTLDSDTRPTHKRLDGQIREVDEPFEMDGKSAMYPGDFGDPAEDCNCRCVSIQRAKWALDENELQTLKDRAKYFGLDKSKDFEDFKKKYLDTVSKQNYTVLEKLNYSGKVTPAIEASLEKSLLKMPERHRTLAESKISGIEITDNPDSSGYDVRTKKIYFSTESDDPDTIIHEYAHGLEDALNIYEDPEFKKVMMKGLENIGLADVIVDEETFMRPIYRIESEKFISLYQGRLYDGFYKGGDSFTLDTMRDYFSEGYREYIVNPDNLKKHDPDLFNYIEGIR